LPANIDKGIKIGKEREREREEGAKKGKQIPSVLLPGITLNKALRFGLNKHNGKLN
jgi:hypothetical protein